MSAVPPSGRARGAGTAYRGGAGVGEGAGGAAQVVLVHDGAGVAVREVELVAQPVDALLEADEAGAGVDFAEPVVQRAAGDLGDAGEQVAVSLI